MALRLSVSRWVRSVEEVRARDSRAMAD